jgi:hypothetical protein
VIVLFGPCMFVAPLLILLIPVAVVLWPPALLVLGLLYLLVWPFALIGRRLNLQWLTSAHAALGRWFIVLLRPWRYFDAPRAGKPSNKP